MSFPHGLVPTYQRVHPTPIYELLGALLITWILWRRGGPERPKPIGQITGEYLILTGIARFLVEFIRINPRILWGMTNAQLASLGAVVFGFGADLGGAGPGWSEGGQRRNGQRPRTPDAAC